MIPRDLFVVAISLFLWGIGEGMFTYFQPLYLQQWGADPLLIGGILGAMGVSMTVAQAPAGYLADRIGPRPVMWASWALGTVAAILMAVANSLAGFVAGMLIYGLTSFVVAPMNAYLTAVRGPWNVERALTIPTAMFNFGMVLGPVIGGAVAEVSGIRHIYALSTGVFVVSTAVILLARREPAEVHIPASGPRPKLWRNPRFIALLALIACTTFALDLPQPLTPNFLQNQAGLSLKTIGQLGSIGSLGNAIITLGLGSLNAAWGFLAGQVLMALFALAMWQGNGVTWYALGYFFVGGFRLTRVMALAYAQRFIHTAETGFAFGLIETANGVAIILAPMAAGILYETDPRGMYVTSLALTVVLVLANLGWRVRQVHRSKAIGDLPAPEEHSGQAAWKSEE